MTTKARVRWLVIGSILLLPILVLTIGYQDYKFRKERAGQPPSFDLFVAETFFHEEDHSPFDIGVPLKEHRPVDWLLIPSQFELLDTVELALTNKSGEKFYYESWGAPFTRHQRDLIIFKDGYPDTIPFDGHGCGTGAHFAPIRKNETITRFVENPLMFNPYTNHRLPLQADSFPYFFNELYGDSVAIIFRQASYSTPWSKYKSQMLSAKPIVVSTKKVLLNWKHRNYGEVRDPILSD